MPKTEKIQKIKTKKEDYWDSEQKGVSIQQFTEEAENSHKMIVYGETGVGKTKFWMGIPEELAEEFKQKPEDIKICVVYPDRATGISKLAGFVPRKLMENDCIRIFTVSNYEDLISSTASAYKILMQHYKNTGKHGWLICELLGEPWTFSQDYYTRQAYGENLGDFFAERKQMSKVIREDPSAFKALEGWKDWTVIKWYHNANWIDKIKRMPFNVLFTSEIKEEDRPDSIFAGHGRPAGEKDNMHRVDEILKLTREKGEYFVRPYKLTGYTHVYPKTKITDKNGFGAHLKMLKKIGKYRVSPMEFAEKEAGIIAPKKPDEKKTEEVAEEIPEKIEKMKEEKKDIEHKVEIEDEAEKEEKECIEEEKETIEDDDLVWD